RRRRAGSRSIGRGPLAGTERRMAAGDQGLEHTIVSKGGRYGRRMTRSLAMPDRSFWKRRRGFLTGHTGFKGSWLSLWRHALGAEVTGYALEPPTEPNLFVQADVAQTLRSIRADIRDLPTLKAAIVEYKPDVVIHMAAQSVVRHGYDDPVGTYSSNVMGTVH